MKQLRLIAPAHGGIEIDELQTRICRALARHRAPFAPELLDFAAALSERLLRHADARRYPELTVLGFFMRRARLLELQDRYSMLRARDTVRSPRGVVFQVPPSNVSSLLVYSWVMAALPGNVNVIRLPSTLSPELLTILQLWNELLETHSAMRENTLLIHYDHDDEVTAALSLLADVRVIWGGDATVEKLRRFALQPAARELTFPDKHSLAIMNTSQYLHATPPERDRLTAKFYNDAYWFDQMACSSPRVIVWVGDEYASREASSDFFDRLSHRIAERGRNASLSAALSKKAFACGAVIDQGVTGCRESGNELTVLDVERLDAITRQHCGNGLFFQAFVTGWERICHFVCRRDQTIGYYGFETAELEELAMRVNGRGVDRIVPIGRALDFSHLWDGYDLLQEFSRVVYVAAAH